MLYKPLDMQPYLETIDGEIAHNFSCRINAEGGTEVTKYQISINDLSNNEVYASDLELLSPSLYNDDILEIPILSENVINGEDYYWKVILYENAPVQEITYGQVNDANSTNDGVFLRAGHYNILPSMQLKIGSEIREIYEYNSSNGAANVTEAFTFVPEEGQRYRVLSDFVISDDSYFKARTTPTLSIDEVVSPINRQFYEFSATYNQSEGIGVKHQTWNLYDSEGKLIKSSGEFSSGALGYRFDGFYNGGSYTVEVIVENKEGIVVEDIVVFSVSYVEPEIDDIPSTKFIPDKKALKTTWSQPMINLGNVDGTGEDPKYIYLQNAPYIGGCSIKLDENNYFTVTPATSIEDKEIKYEHTTFLHMTFPLGFEGDIYKEEAVPIQLIAATSIEPESCNIGDKYYNTITKLIYTAIDTDIWGVNGEVGSDSCIYQVDSTLYIWEDGLVETTYDVPYYKLWYANQTFYYEINNMEVQQSGQYSFIGDAPNIVWLLHPLGSSLADLYVWEDTAYWEDVIYWYEQGYDTISYSWWKFTLLPNSINIHRNTIEHLNAFNESGISMYYDTRIFKDSPLFKDDVLYI